MALGLVLLSNLASSENCCCLRRRQCVNSEDNSVRQGLLAELLGLDPIAGGDDDSCGTMPGCPRAALIPRRGANDVRIAAVAGDDDGDRGDGNRPECAAGQLRCCYDSAAELERAAGQFCEREDWRLVGCGETEFERMEPEDVLALIPRRDRVGRKTCGTRCE